jgi:Ca2+-binding RTX toxin-like protein
MVAGMTRKMALLAAAVTLGAVAVALPDRAAAVATCRGLPATVVGPTGTGVNVIIGTDAQDVIVGTNGDDVIHGNGGDDLICAWGGADEVYGGPGRDRVHGGTGDDHLDGRTGGDHLYGDADSDSLRGGDGPDYLDGGSGQAESIGTVGDLCLGDGGDDSFTRTCERTVS